MNETMMHRILPTILTAFALIASPLAAQVALPGVQVPGVGGVVDGVTNRARTTLDDVDTLARREAEELLRTRERTLDRLLRRNRDTIERDASGNLARRGELLALGISPALVDTLRAAGFSVLSREEIEGLDIAVVRLGLPEGLPLAEAEALARSLAPGAEIAPDTLHFRASSSAGPPITAALPALMQGSSRTGVEVGIIDGATGTSVRTVGTKGFAKGAPTPSHHGSAVASLLRRAGVARVRVADVYGKDPAGGNALAIARGLGWLTASGSKVVTVSLVGPKNALVERAIAAARKKGVVVVAAVGNDGPAAPPAYPASYPGVVAVTGVDKRGRALIEAGRALHLDYAAPGADIYGHNARGKPIRLRGTSFATPLAAARLAAALERGGNWRALLDGEARDLGRKGPDETFGRGLLCGDCAKEK